jgi:hypothetical protein
VAIAGGLVAYREPLGATPALAVVHAAAFLLVAVAAWLLAPAQVKEVPKSGASSTPSIPAALPHGLGGAD